MSPRSITCDKEHSTASLGHSEVPSVQHSPCAEIPAFIQPPNDIGKGSSASDSNRVFDIFPNDPSRVDASHNVTESQRQHTALVIHSALMSLYREGLARRSADDDVDRRERVEVFFGDVSIIWDLGVSLSQQTTAERLNFAEPLRVPRKRSNSHRECLYAAADAAVTHWVSPVATRPRSTYRHVRMLAQSHCGRSSLDWVNAVPLATIAAYAPSPRVGRKRAQHSGRQTARRVAKYVDFKLFT